LQRFRDISGFVPESQFFDTALLFRLKFWD